MRLFQPDIADSLVLELFIGSAERNDGWARQCRGFSDEPAGGIVMERA
jgi:hypothetical protein